MLSAEVRVFPLGLTNCYKFCPIVNPVSHRVATCAYTLSDQGLASVLEMASACGVRPIFEKVNS